MDRKMVGVVVTGVAALTVAAFFLLSPTTGPGVSGPELALSPAVGEAPTTPSPAPSARPQPGPAPVASRTPDRSASTQSSRPSRGEHASPRRPSSAEIAAARRRRYTDSGHDRIRRSVDTFAASFGWNEEIREEVYAIVEVGQERGSRIVQGRYDGDNDPQSIDAALQELQEQELESLRQVLGEEEADFFATKAGLHDAR